MNPIPLESVGPDITIIFSSDATLAAISQLGTIAALDPTVVSLVTGEFYMCVLGGSHACKVTKNLISFPD